MCHRRFSIFGPDEEDRLEYFEHIEVHAVDDTS